jgi:hypothetical protein
MDIKKSPQQASATPTGTPNEAELLLIHKFTRSALKAEELYTFSVKLCDNEIDRDGERFTTQCLKALQSMFVGKTGMFDHSGKSGDQTMRIYETYMEKNGSYAALCAKVYLPRSEENAALIREIDAGIKKEVSVACAVKRVKCSVCGKMYGRQGCAHKKGAFYDGKLCHAVLEEPTDAYEFSFVAVPAQPAAGVLKKRKHAGSAYMEELERLAEDGRAYRAELLEKTVKAGLTAVPELERALLHAMCEGLPTAQLRQLHGTLKTKAARELPLCPQLSSAVAKDGNEGFRC